MDEKKRLECVVQNKELPYMKSLNYGIENAKKKLKECECKAELQTSYELVPAAQLNYWSKLAFEYAKCSEHK